MARQRQRPPTDEQKTSIYDSKNTKSRSKSDTRKGFESGDIPTVDIGTPTHVDPPPRERSEPIKVISMKASEDKKRKSAKQHKAEIRSLASARLDATPPRAMGYLAPPADPRERQARKMRDWLIWGSVLVIISCVVMLGVWFLAGR